MKITLSQLSSLTKEQLNHRIQDILGDEDDTDYLEQVEILRFLSNALIDDLKYEFAHNLSEIVNNFSKFSGIAVIEFLPLHLDLATPSQLAQAYYFTLQQLRTNDYNELNHKHTKKPS